MKKTRRRWEQARSKEEEEVEQKSSSIKEDEEEREQGQAEKGGMGGKVKKGSPVCSFEVTEMLMPLTPLIDAGGAL